MQDFASTYHLCRPQLGWFIDQRGKSINLLIYIFLGFSCANQDTCQVLAQLNEESRTSEEELLHNASYGFILFGVPNRGLRHQELLSTVINRRPSERLIRDLIVDQDSEASPLLRELDEKFRRCTEAQRLHVVSFYETKPSQTVEVCAHPSINDV